MSFDFRRLLVIAASLFIVSSSTPAAAQIVLPFLEDWEGTGGETYTVNTPSLTGAPEWAYETIGTNGRLRLAAGNGYYKSGSRAATLDKDPSGTPATINYLILTLDMSNYDATLDAVVLDFSLMHHGEENHANDRVWVRGNNTAPWLEIANIFTLKGSTGQYVDIVDLNVSGLLVANSQNFSTTFQVRLGQEDDFPSTSLTASDGFTFDDIRLRHVLNDDVGVSAIVAPSNFACGELMQDVVITVTNFGAVTKSNIPVMVDVAGDINATFMTTVAGPLAKNQSTQVTLGPIDTFSGAVIDITAATALPGDQQPANDQAFAALSIDPTEIFFSPPAPVCPGSPATIDVTVEPDTDYVLFDTDTGGTPLDQGFSLVTPPVEQATTFYLERTNLAEGVGPLDEMIGTGTYYPTFTDGLVFSVAQQIVVDTVYVYPGGPGNVTVRLLGPTNAVIGSVTKAVTAADTMVKTPIALGFVVPAGTGYKLDAVGTTVSTLFRNSDGASYPYNSTSVTITGAKNGLPNAYYFFYDWQITQNIVVCDAERTPVEVTVDAGLCSADLVVTIDGPAAADPGDTVEYTVTVANGGPTVAAATNVSLEVTAGATFASASGDCVALPCDLGNLQSGESRSFIASYLIDGGFDGTLTATATATSTSPDPNPGDESASVTTTVMGGAGGAGGGATTGTGGGATGTGGGAGVGGGAALPAESDEGCGCRVAGASGGELRWLAFALALGIAVLRRRRR
jgi:uncharacterized repeat protein (TIGR01451 family)/MYXO-CTERM domain-containing protein